MPKFAASQNAKRGDCDAPNCSRARNANPFAVLCDFHLAKGTEATTPEQDAFYKQKYGGK